MVLTTVAPASVEARRRDPATRAIRRVCEFTLFAVVPLVLLWQFTFGVPRATIGWDFHGMWFAATQFIHGGDIYASAGVSSVGLAYPPYVYPPTVAVGLAPLGALPFLAAAAIFIAASVGALIAAMWLLGVRDWRCYGAAFLWLPVVHGLRLGALTAVLLFGIALCWRVGRLSRWSSPVLALAAVTKLFLWPVMAWSSCRLRAATTTVTVAAAIAIVSWAAIGFRDVGRYWGLLRETSPQWQRQGYGLGAVAQLVGFPTSLVTVILLCLAAAAVSAVIRMSRSGLLDDRQSLILLVGTALALSPAAWLHYSTLLVVPVALASPELSWLWLVPLLLWLTPSEGSLEAPWRVALVLAVTVTTTAVAMLGVRPIETSESSSGVASALGVSRRFGRSAS